MMSSRSLLVLAALAALAAGCNSKPGSAQRPGINGQPQSGSAWTLTLQSSCAGQEQCVAQHGFAVGADGAYRIGPGPQGQLRSGQLTESELSELQRRIDAALPTFGALGETSSERHQADVENTSDDTLLLSAHGAADRLVARNQSSDYYYTTASLDDAQALHAAIKDLANSYYRLPFGNACGDAADKISTAMAKLDLCRTDSDCVYVDAYRGFAVVPPSGVQWLLTEDCAAVAPPVVANKLSILGGAQALQERYAQARTVCGDGFYQSAYGQACAIEQKPTSTQPTCVQGKCRSRL